MKLEIKSKDKKHFITTILQLLKVVVPNIKALRSKDIEVLSILILENFNNAVDVKDENKRWMLILHSDNRKKMSEELKISSASFENSLTQLRKVGIIKDNKLVKSLSMNPSKEVSITFNIK